MPSKSPTDRHRNFIARIEALSEALAEASASLGELYAIGADKLLEGITIEARAKLMRKSWRMGPPEQNRPNARANVHLIESHKNGGTP